MNAIKDMYDVKPNLSYKIVFSNNLSKNIKDNFINIILNITNSNDINIDNIIEIIELINTKINHIIDSYSYSFVNSNILTKNMNIIFNNMLDFFDKII